MKIGLVEKILIAVSVLVVLGSFAFAVSVRPTADRVAVLKTLGMTCGSCAGAIEKALLETPGVSEVTVNVEAAQVIAAYDSKVTAAPALASAVTAAGYRSGVARELTADEYQKLSGNAAAQGPAKSGCGSACCN